MCFDGFKLYSMIAGVGLPMIVFFQPDCARDAVRKGRADAHSLIVPTEVTNIAVSRNRFVVSVQNNIVIGIY